MDWVLPLTTLTLMEIVLGIDNIIFLSILVSALPPHQQNKARLIGLALALGGRMLLLLGIRLVMGLSKPVFAWSQIGFVPDIWVQNHHVDTVTGRDLVLFFGGLFLLAKSVVEIHKKTTGGDRKEVAGKARGGSFGGILFQVLVLDLVFSLDSVISAIGMVQDVWIMVVAMLTAIVFMAAFSSKVAHFLDQNPTFQMLALSFLVMIGVVLVAEALGTHIGKGYIYAAMVFALVVELLNMRVRKHRDAVPP